MQTGSICFILTRSPRLYALLQYKGLAKPKSGVPLAFLGMLLLIKLIIDMS